MSLRKKMKYLKIKQNGKLYQFEAKDRQGLILQIEEYKKRFLHGNIELMTSNVFKIKKGKNEELSNIFSQY